MATRPRTENNPFAYGMRLLAVFYNEMEKNKDKISFIKSYQEIEKIFYNDRCVDNEFDKIFLLDPVQSDCFFYLLCYNDEW